MLTKALYNEGQVRQYEQQLSEAVDKLTKIEEHNWSDEVIELSEFSFSSFLAFELLSFLNLPNLSFHQHTLFLLTVLNLFFNVVQTCFLSNYFTYTYCTAL